MVDGASPQVYFAGRHNPLDQLSQTFLEYAKWGKPLYPIGPTFGETFTVAGERFWWEPSVNDLVSFRMWCQREEIPKIYYYSLDYVLSRKRFDWLEAATGVLDPPPPPEPPEPEEIEPDYLVITTAHPALNVRAAPTVKASDLGNLIPGSIVPVVGQDGDWLHIDGWIHKDWTKKIET